MPYLQDLFQATGEHVQWAVLDEPDALIVDKSLGLSAVDTVGWAAGRLRRRPGAARVLRRATQERVLAGRLDAFNGRTHTSGRRLRAELVRRVGFTVSE